MTGSMRYGVWSKLYRNSRESTWVEYKSVVRNCIRRFDDQDGHLQRMGGWKTPKMLERYAHLNVEHLSPYADNSSMDRTKSGTVESEAELEAV
jgi:hypothetical protein